MTMIVNCKYNIRIRDNLEYFVGSTHKHTYMVVTFLSEPNIYRYMLKLFITGHSNVLIRQHQYG